MGKSKKVRKVQNSRSDPLQSNGASNGHVALNGMLASSVLDTITAQLQSGLLFSVKCYRNCDGFMFSQSRGQGLRLPQHQQPLRGGGGQDQDRGEEVCQDDRSPPPGV